MRSLAVFHPPRRDLVPQLVFSNVGQSFCYMRSQPDSPAPYQAFKYVPTLDGWRAISVLAVIYYHSLHNGLRPGTWSYRLAIHGCLGVDMFFAISGFLICGKLLNELNQTQTISLKRFYLRRFFRIMPPLWTYLAVLAILTLAGWISVNNWEFGSSLFFVRNYLPTYRHEVLGQYTAHFWSLAVEEHFYLLVPVAMFCFGRKLRRFAWCILLAALCVFVWRSIDVVHPWLMPFGASANEKTDTRIDALLWGCLAALVYPKIACWLKSRSWRNVWLPLAVVLAGAVRLHIPGITLLEAVSFPALLMSTASFPDSVVSRILEWPLLRWIGRLSYSLYIWQQLVIFPAVVPHSPISAIQQVPLNLALLFVVASASYYFIEKPAIRLGRRLETPSRLTFGFTSVPVAAK